MAFAFLGNAGRQGLSHPESRDAPRARSPVPGSTPPRRSVAGASALGLRDGSKSNRAYLRRPRHYHDAGRSSHASVSSGIRIPAADLCGDRRGCVSCSPTSIRGAPLHRRVRHRPARAIAALTVFLHRQDYRAQSREYSGETSIFAPTLSGGSAPAALLGTSRLRRISTVCRDARRALVDVHDLVLADLTPRRRRSSCAGARAWTCT